MGRRGHAPGIFRRLRDWFRGREQLLVRPAGALPMLLVSYPSGAQDAAREVEAAWTHTFVGLGAGVREIYAEVLEKAPSMLVILLDAFQACECLGHCHPRGTETRLTRRLAADLGEPIGEIDLAYEGIRGWEPEPLASLAVGELGGARALIHFQAGLLAVLLHELEHLVFPERAEQEIRRRSNAFYTAAMQALVREESGAGYGMASPPPLP